MNKRVEFCFLLSFVGLMFGANEREEGHRLSGGTRSGRNLEDSSSENERAVNEVNRHDGLSMDELRAIAANYRIDRLDTKSVSSDDSSQEEAERPKRPILFLSRTTRRENAASESSIFGD